MTKLTEEADSEETWRLVARFLVPHLDLENFLKAKYNEVKYLLPGISQTRALAHAQAIIFEQWFGYDTSATFGDPQDWPRDAFACPPFTEGREASQASHQIKRKDGNNEVVTKDIIDGLDNKLEEGEVYEGLEGKLDYHPIQRKSFNSGHETVSSPVFQQQHNMDISTTAEIDGKSGCSVQLPWAFQHQILYHLQRFLEDSWYDFTASHAPGILAACQLTHHKHGEMQHFLWYNAIKSQVFSFGQGVIRLKPSQDLDALFDNAHQIRHAVVHRKRDITMNETIYRVGKALELLHVLKDDERADGVECLLQDLKSFEEHFSLTGGFQLPELPIANRKYRRERVRDLVEYFGLVMGFLKNENDLPKQYAILDA